MSGNLQEAAEAIGALASTITGIENVETRPKLTAGRNLPAIFVTYDSFKQAPMTFGPTWEMVYTFQLTLYLALDGRNMETQWDSLLDLSNKIADTFRSSFTLEGTAWSAVILGGRAIIDTPRSPQAKSSWIGHRFQLEVTFEES
jgi:DNA-binding XRE family transcriptional regulator